MNKIKFWLIAYLIKSISVKQANTLAQWDDFQEYAEKMAKGNMFSLGYSRLVLFNLLQRVEERMEDIKSEMPR